MDLWIDILRPEPDPSPVHTCIHFYIVYTLQSSWIAFHITGIGKAEEDRPGRVSVGPKDPSQMRSPLVVIEAFLAALTSADKDGRIVISKGGWKKSL